MHNHKPALIGLCLLLTSANRVIAASYFLDHILRDQNSKAVRFYSDLVKGRTVVIHSFFLTYHDSCPMMLGKLKLPGKAQGINHGH